MLHVYKIWCTKFFISSHCVPEGSEDQCKVTTLQTEEPPRFPRRAEAGEHGENRAKSEEPCLGETKMCCEMLWAFRVLAPMRNEVQRQRGEEAGKTWNKTWDNVGHKKTSWFGRVVALQCVAGPDWNPSWVPRLCAVRLCWSLAVMRARTWVGVCVCDTALRTASSAMSF